MTEKIFRIEKNDILGSYMVANKTIKQGELILKEKPIMIGPQINGLLHCFNCFKAINPNRYKVCFKCGVALICNQLCKGTYHTDEECNHLSAVKIDTTKLAANHQIIFALRCIMLKNYSPETFEKILSLEPHLEARRDTTIWRRHKIAIEDVLKDMGVFGEHELEEEMVQRICGILDVNTFEIRPKNVDHFSQSKPFNPEFECLRGLYPKSAMMAHDCHGNVHLSVDDYFILTVHASVDIKKDDMILFNYAGVLQGYVDRQKHLQEGKYFTCTCRRCEDPSELGTELSSLRCHKCLKGLIRPDKGAKKWSCDACMGSFRGQVVQLAVDEAVRRVEETDPTDIEALESLYKKLSLTFHPNHYVLLNLKQNMVLLYSGLPPSINNLNRKIDLCARLLSVYSKLEPGISRIRALILYELQSAMVDLLHKQYRLREINEETLVNELLTAEHILKDALKNLLYEPSHSPEGRVAQMAMKELKMLRSSIKAIQEELIGNMSDMNINSQEARKIDVNKRLKDKLESNKNKNKKDDADNKEQEKLQNKNKEDVSSNKKTEKITESKNIKKENVVQDNANENQKRAINIQNKKINSSKNKGSANNNPAKNDENRKESKTNVDNKQKDKNNKKTNQESAAKINKQNSANNKQNKSQNIQDKKLEDGDNENLANNKFAENDENSKELQINLDNKKKDKNNKITNQENTAIGDNQESVKKTQKKLENSQNKNLKGSEIKNLTNNKSSKLNENTKKLKADKNIKTNINRDQNDLKNKDAVDLLTIKTEQQGNPTKDVQENIVVVKCDLDKNIKANVNHDKNDLINKNSIDLLESLTENNEDNTVIDVKENIVIVECNQDKSNIEVDNDKSLISVKSSKRKRSKNKNKK